MTSILTATACVSSEEKGMTVLIICVALSIIVGTIATTIALEPLLDFWRDEI